MKASELDEKFDNNENILSELDLNQTKRPGGATKRINVDFPTWMVVSLDREAHRLGITRQSIIKMWLAERLENTEQHR